MKKIQALVKKKFVLYYNESFPGGERVQLVGVDFFTEDKGFRAYDIRNIEKLEVPHSLNIGGLKIWRVK